MGWNVSPIPNLQRLKFVNGWIPHFIIYLHTYPYETHKTSLILRFTCNLWDAYHEHCEETDRVTKEFNNDNWQRYITDIQTVYGDTDSNRSPTSCRPYSWHSLGKYIFNPPTATIAHKNLLELWNNVWWIEIYFQTTSLVKSHRNCRKPLFQSLVNCVTVCGTTPLGSRSSIGTMIVMFEFDVSTLKVRAQFISAKNKVSITAAYVLALPGPQHLQHRYLG